MPMPCLLLLTTSAAWSLSVVCFHYQLPCIDLSDSSKQPHYRPHFMGEATEVRDSSCDLLQALPGCHPRSYHPVCFLQELRHPVWFVHHSYTLPSAASARNRCSMHKGFQNKGLSRGPCLMKQHCGDAPLVPALCQGLQSAPGAWSKCLRAKAALSRGLESARLMGPSCILIAPSFASAAAFVKLPSKQFQSPGNDSSLFWDGFQCVPRVPPKSCVTFSACT